jgi:hypothetical protein
METIEEVKTETKVMYWQNPEAENAKRNAVKDAARALEDLYSVYEFGSISMIPTDVTSWITQRTFETNPELKKLAQTIKLSSLNYEVPGWIRKQGEAISRFNVSREKTIQQLDFILQDKNKFHVQSEKLEQLFSSSEAYRKYYTNEQVKRLELCKRFISVLRDAGISEITFNSTTIWQAPAMNPPLLRVFKNKFYPCHYYITSGMLNYNAPTIQPFDYEINVDL